MPWRDPRRACEAGVPAPPPALAPASAPPRAAGAGAAALDAADGGSDKEAIFCGRHRRRQVIPRGRGAAAPPHTRPSPDTATTSPQAPAQGLGTREALTRVSPTSPSATGLQPARRLLPPNATDFPWSSAFSARSTVPQHNTDDGRQMTTQEFGVSHQCVIRTTNTPWQHMAALRPP